MSTLTGRTVATTYKDLLQISNQNAGIDGNFRYIEDGEGTISVLALSIDGIQIAGHVTPSLDQVYDLGNSDKRFRDLWLSGNTIHIGDTVFTSEDVQAVKDIQTTSVPVSSIAELASTSVQPGDAISFSTLINRPTTLDGYGITDAATASDMVETIDALDTILEPLYTEVNAASADWNDTRTTVSNNSGDWFSPPELTNLLQTSSGTWNTATQPDTNVQFDNLTVTGHIAGPATLTIDPAAVGDNTGRVVIAGDLQVDGVTTTVNSTTMTVSGKTITLAEGATDPSMTDQSGIHVDHVDVNILYDSTTDTWRTNRDLVVQDKLTAATLSATGHVVVDGTVDAAGDLKVQGDSVVTQSDVGTAPNQIPQNKDLGSLAYQDAAQIEDLTVDTLQLRGIAAELQSDAVDVFVYDTRKDSDGGEWRERTSHTSWYNEELNTATRGSRREFPSVAVIVVEEYKVSIYDGDDPDLPMWMVFNRNITGNLILASDRKSTACEALNGQVFIPDTVDLGVIDFLKDRGFVYGSRGLYDSHCVIAERNELSRVRYLVINDELIINEGSVNDVSVTVLPGAPIDTGTGLPVSTIAVATDNGVSVIKHDGSVVDITSGQATFTYCYNIIFDQLNRLFFSIDGAGNSRRIWGLNTIPSSNLVISTDINSKQNGDIFIADNNGFGTGKDMLLFNGSNPQATGFAPDNSIGTNQGLFKSSIDQVDSSRSLHNYITSTYNTGWMCGDIKLATLSDTKIETVGVDETELVTNGTFNSNTTGWDGTNSATLSIDNQRLKIQGGGASYPTAYTSVNVVEGIEYEVSAQYISNSDSFSGRIRVSSSSPLGGDIINGDIKTPSNNHIYRFTASSTGSVYVALLLQDVTGNSSGIWDNISVKQTGELITNGTFNNGTEGWETTSVTNSLISVTNEQLTVNRNGNGFYASGTHQAIDTVVGEYYTVSVDVVSATNYSNLQIVTDVSTQTSRQNTEIASDSFNEDSKTGTLVATFTATTSVTYIILTTANNPYAESVFDNVSVRLAEDDRSVNNNGLQVFGEIDKTPVAPGADLVAYSGFSADNYLMQPYNSDLDFGTGDFCVMGWAKISNTSAGIINIMRNGDTQAKSWRLTLGNANGDIVWQRPDSSAMITFSSSAVSGSFAHYCITRRSSTIYFYINGRQITFSATGNSGDNYTSDNSVLKVYGGGSTSSSQYISLWRISATAPTAEQIAKIYRDEKALFTDGAQATLYGTSDAVTALAYDDKTHKLHVGTSHNRSTFKNIRRIDSTDQPVTTAISSYDDLIAEQ